MKESHAKQLENITFFVDRSLGKQFANGLEEIGLNVEKHDDHFSQTTLDIEWLAKCGENNWVIVSGDKNIKRNHIEKSALLNSGVAAFFFTSGGLNTETRVTIFSKGLKRVANILSTYQKPFIARLDKEGKVEVWMNHKGEDLIVQKQERLRLKKQKSAE
jgi:predicted nuclease of predicted toxin-antitoxin system